MYFRYFVIISPWKRAEPFIWTNLNPLYPRMLCAKFGWNWPSGSGEEDENVKSLRQRRRQRQRQRRRRTTDKFWSEKLTWAFGSGELKISDWVLMSQHIMKFIDRNSWKSIWVRIRVYLSIWWSTWMRKITETNDNTNILLGWSFFKNSIIQIIFMREVGKCPKQSGNTAAVLVEKSYMESYIHLQKYQKILRIGIKRLSQLYASICMMFCQLSSIFKE